jgi:methionyl-tRNA formyltransferase
LVKLAIFTANHIGYELLKKLDSYNYYPNIVTYKNNFQRTALSRDFSEFTNNFPITFISSNKYIDVKQKIKFLDSDYFICIDWTKDFFKNIPENEIKNKSGKQINVLLSHPSLLPMYRGYGAISEQFIRGVAVSGLTFYKLSETIDGGDIVFQKEIKIEFSDYPLDFMDKLTDTAVDFILNLKDIGDSYLKSVPQNENNAFYLTRQRGKQALIDFNKNAFSLYNHIRGYAKPFFGAFFIHNDEKVYVWHASVESWQGDYGKSGEIIKKNENGIEVAVGDGSIIISKIEINNEIYKNEDIPFEKGDILR